MQNVFKFLRKINFKSVRFNFKYLPFKDALKFPFLIANNIILKEINGVVIINKPVKTGMIQLGYNYGGVGLFDEKKSKGIWQVSGKVIFKGTARIGHGVKISVDTKGVLELGNNFAITAESSIIAKQKIIFGNDCLISWECLFMDSDFHKIYDAEGKWINKPAQILIKNKVWIGCRNLILKGSTIESNSIIGANSVINKKLIEPNSIYAGNPTKLIKKNVKWEI